MVTSPGNKSRSRHWKTPFVNLQATRDVKYLTCGTWTQDLCLEYVVSDVQITHLAYNRGSSVSTVTRLRAGLNSGSGEIFFCLSRLHDRHWGPSTMGNADSSPVENAAEASSWLHRQLMPKLRMNGLIPPIPYVHLYFILWDLVISITVEQALKAQRGSRSIALFFL